MRILVINGPNLNLLGTREPDTYGNLTLDDLEQQWHQRTAGSGATIESMQTNHEGAIVDAIGEAAGRYDGLIINAGALTHYSYAITDAITASQLRTVEVHISNIREREAWRHTSVLEPVCDLSIIGRGTDGYLHAIDHLVATTTAPPIVVEYGTTPTSVLDLRTPDGAGPHPVSLLIHGGFWKDIWTRDIMDPMAVALTDHGWATANVDYSLGHGSYVSSLGDVRDALAWIHSNADTYNLDRDRVTLIGHSAGGYLALRIAHETTMPMGVIGLAPVTDLAAIADLRPTDDPVSPYLGAPRDEAPRLWDQAELAGSPQVPITLIVATEDDDVPPVLSGDYVARFQSVVSATTVAGCNHMDLIDPGSEAWSALVNALDHS